VVIALEVMHTTVAKDQPNSLSLSLPHT